MMPNQKKPFKFKSWGIVGISIFSLVVGLNSYYSKLDLENQYNHLKNKMTEAEQIYASRGLENIKTQTYILFIGSIITGIMAVIGFYWFDDKRFLN